MIPADLRLDAALAAGMAAAAEAHGLPGRS